MGTSKHQPLPPDLAWGRSRFQSWRAARKAGSRIPPALWELAVRLARSHGVSHAATALSLDYYSLQRRAEAADIPAPPSGPAFVELAAPVMVAKQCRFELDSGSGATIRVQLVGYDAADLEALARGFGDAR